MSDVGRGEVAAGPTSAANRAWWDSVAPDYQAEHGSFLGDSDFLWCPEGLREADARLLGNVAGVDVLDFGCGAGQTTRWLQAAGARVIGLDLSEAQLRHSREIDLRRGSRVPVLVADATTLPLRDATFDVACSSYGAMPFVADVGAVLRELARVVRPGGRIVFSTAHPVRWCFPDDPGEGGLIARDSYFDRRAYVEYDDKGAPSYVEHHRTLGDWVREIVDAGLVLEDLVEPEWPAGHDRVWGGWSPLRGRVIPGTAIFLVRRP